MLRGHFFVDTVCVPAFLTDGSWFKFGILFFLAFLVSGHEVSSLCLYIFLVLSCTVLLVVVSLVVSSSAVWKVLCLK